MTQETTPQRTKEMMEEFVNSSNASLTKEKVISALESLKPADQDEILNTKTALEFFKKAAPKVYGEPDPFSDIPWGTVEYTEEALDPFERAIIEASRKQIEADRAENQEKANKRKAKEAESKEPEEPQTPGADLVGPATLFLEIFKQRANLSEEQRNKLYGDSVSLKDNLSKLTHEERQTFERYMNSGFNRSESANKKKASVELESAVNLVNLEFQSSKAMIDWEVNEELLEEIKQLGNEDFQKFALHMREDFSLLVSSKDKGLASDLAEGVRSADEISWEDVQLSKLVTEATELSKKNHDNNISATTLQILEKIDGLDDERFGKFASELPNKALSFLKTSAQQNDMKNLSYDLASRKRNSPTHRMVADFVKKLEGLNFNSDSEISSELKESGINLLKDIAKLGSPKAPDDFINVARDFGGRGSRKQKPIFIVFAQKLTKEAAPENKEVFKLKVQGLIDQEFTWMEPPELESRSRSSSVLSSGSSGIGSSVEYTSGSEYHSDHSRNPSVGSNDSGINYTVGSKPLAGNLKAQVDDIALGLQDFVRGTGASSQTRYSASKGPKLKGPQKT